MPTRRQIIKVLERDLASHQKSISALTTLIKELQDEDEHSKAPAPLRRQGSKRKPRKSPRHRQRDESSGESEEN